MKSPGDYVLRKYFAFLGGIILALAATGGILYLYFVAPRIVVRATMPNGLELCVIQRMEVFCYNTGVFYRKPDGSGGGFYYDHEDTAWGRGRVVLDHQSKLATVFRQNKPVILFNWETELCSVRNGAFRNAGTHGRPPSLAFWNPFSWHN